MLSISLGPVALPLLPVLWLGAVWWASWGAERWARHLAPDAPAQATHAGQVVMVAALIGGLAARLGHVVRHAEVFASSPWSVLDVRDGGASWVAGGLAGVIALAWGLRHTPGLRRPVWGACALSASGALMLGWTLGVGRPPPPVSVPVQALDGSAQVLHLGQATGRPRVVNLWASWCGPCRAEMPLLVAAQRRETELDILFVNQGESAAAVRAYLNDQGLTPDHVWLDSARALGPALGSPGLPTTVFYDAHGQVVSRHFGILTAVALETELRALRPSPSSSSSASHP